MGPAITERDLKKQESAVVIVNTTSAGSGLREFLFARSFCLQTLCNALRTLALLYHSVIYVADRASISVSSSCSEMCLWSIWKETSEPPIFLKFGGS